MQGQETEISGTCCCLLCLFVDEILALTNGVLSMFTRGRYLTSVCKESSLFVPPFAKPQKKKEENLSSVQSAVWLSRGRVTGNGTW